MRLIFFFLNFSDNFFLQFFRLRFAIRSFIRALYITWLEDSRIYS